MTRPDRPSVVLISHQVRDEGGMERAAAELVKRTHDQIDFTVIARHASDEIRSLATWRRVAVPARPVSALYPTFAAAASLLARREKADIVHSVGVNTIGVPLDCITVPWCQAGAHRAIGAYAPAGGPRSRRLNTATVKWMALRTERLAMKAKPLALCVSPGVAREVEACYPGTVTRQTPNAVDVQRFRPSAMHRADVRAELGVPAEALVAIFVGGDWDRKGLASAIKALAMVPPSTSGLELWVAGAGDERRFGDLARSVGCQERVRFLGRRTDVERYLAASDIFVLPTLYETFSLAGYEAASCGLPVLAPRVSGLEDLIGADESGGRFITQNPESIAEPLRELAASVEKRRALAARAASFASAFTWERSAQSVLDAYEELLSKRRTTER